MVPTRSGKSKSSLVNRSGVVEDSPSVKLDVPVPTSTFVHIPNVSHRAVSSTPVRVAQKAPSVLPPAAAPDNSALYEDPLVVPANVSFNSPDSPVVLQDAAIKKSGGGGSSGLADFTSVEQSALPPAGRSGAVAVDTPLPVDIPVHTRTSRRIKLKDSEFIGKRIKVWWPEYDTWYPGVVVAKSDKPEFGTHEVLYDDERDKGPIYEFLMGQKKATYKIIS